MDRKKFIRTCCMALGVPVVSLGLPGCNAPYFARYALSGRRFIIPRSEFTGERNGKPFPRKFVLLRHDMLPFPIGIYPTGSGAFTALYLRCTHRGCALKPGDGYLVCPCHGSEFSSTGKVIQPPAEEDLQQFPVLTDEKYIYVQV